MEGDDDMVGELVLDEDLAFPTGTLEVQGAGSTPAVRVPLGDGGYRRTRIFCQPAGTPDIVVVLVEPGS
jgi:hypothetical protein